MKIRVRILVLLVLLVGCLSILAARDCCTEYREINCGWFGCSYFFPEDCDAGGQCSSVCYLDDLGCNWGMCCCEITCKGFPLAE